MRRHRALLLAFLYLSGCSGYARRHLDAGDAKFRERDYRQAIDEYQRALRADRNNQHGIRQIGLAYYNLGDVHEASVFLARAADLAPNDVDVRLKLANLYLITRQPDRASALASAVLAADSTNRDALKIRGLAFLAKQSPREALTTFQQLAALDTTNGEPHYLLGLALIAVSDRAAARGEFVRARALSPSASDATIQLIQLDLSEGRRDEALLLATEAVARDGANARLRSMLGAVYAMRGQLADAESAFSATIQLDPKQVDARIALADLLGRSGRAREGVQVANEALQLDSTNVTTLLVLAELQHHLGDEKEAGTLYARAGNLAPNDVRVAYAYGWYLYNSRDYNRAVDMLSAVASALPNDPAAQYRAGVAAKAVGDTSSARASLERAVRSPVAFAERQAAERVLASLR